MSAAVAAILEGMPEPRDLRMHELDGRCVIMAGSTVLFDYAAGDVVMRNIALAALRQLGFKGRVVAAVLGLTENYVATLWNAAKRDGSAALIRHDRPGAPGRGTQREWEQSRAGPGRGPGARAGGGPGAGAGAGGGPPPGRELPAWPLPAEGVFASRYAGAMLLHAFFAQADAGGVLAAAGSGADRRPGDVPLLSAVSMCFALGEDTVEQFKHLA